MTHSRPLSLELSQAIADLAHSAAIADSGCVCAGAQEDLRQILRTLAPLEIVEFSASVAGPAIEAGAENPAGLRGFLADLLDGRRAVAVTFHTGVEEGGDYVEQVGALFYPHPSDEEGMVYLSLAGLRCECCGKYLAVDATAPMVIIKETVEALHEDVDYFDAIADNLRIDMNLGAWGRVTRDSPDEDKTAICGSMGRGISMLPAFQAVYCNAAPTGSAQA